MSNLSQVQNVPPLTIASLGNIVSQERLGKYINAAAHKPDVAIRLYVWNTRVGEAFFSPIQAIEVCLRNRIATAFADEYGPDWWQDNRFLGTVGRKGVDNIEDVKNRLRRARKPIETNRIIADLSFGFWVNGVGGRFNPDVWSSRLYTFMPDLPATIDRRLFHDRVEKVADLRNRIFHHEPIFNEDISKRYSDCLELLGWLSQEKRAWLKPYFRVAEVMRQKPKP